MQETVWILIPSTETATSSSECILLLCLTLAASDTWSAVVDWPFLRVEGVCGRGGCVCVGRGGKVLDQWKPRVPSLPRCLETVWRRRTGERNFSWNHQTNFTKQKRDNCWLFSLLDAVKKTNSNVSSYFCHFFPPQQEIHLEESICFVGWQHIEPRRDKKEAILSQSLTDRQEMNKDIHS